MIAWAMDSKKKKFREFSKTALVELRRGGVLENLRRDYLSLIAEHDLDNTAHIRKISDWVFYPFFCAMIPRFLPGREAKIIDWGGWYGQVTRILMEMGYSDVSNYLLDAPPHYDEFAQKFSLATIHGKEPNRLELDDASLDLFISSGVLEHVAEDGVGDEDLIVTEIIRVLKPGGWFFIWNLPAMLGSSEILAYVARKWRHERRFWLKEALSLLQRHGLTIELAAKHKFLPGSLTNIIAKRMDVVSMTGWDERLSRLFPLSIFARDYCILARKPGPIP